MGIPLLQSPKIISLENFNEYERTQTYFPSFLLVCSYWIYWSSVKFSNTIEVYDNNRCEARKENSHSSDTKLFHFDSFFWLFCFWCYVFAFSHRSEIGLKQKTTLDSVYLMPTLFSFPCQQKKDIHNRKLLNWKNFFH